MRRSITLFSAAILTLGALACGDPAESPSSPTAGGGSQPSGPDAPVSMTPGSRDVDPGAGGRPQRVRPRPGMTDLRPVAWEKARQTPDGRHLRVTYWSGVEPCNVLDHVDVRYAEDSITITLYEGSDPEQPDVACIEIALQKFVKLQLDEPVDGRKLKDGAP